MRQYLNSRIQVIVSATVERGNMDSTLRDKSYLFALRVVKLYRYLVAEQKEYTLSRQVLRSGTPMDALVR